MAKDIKLSEEEEAKRQVLAQRLQNNILGLGDVEAAIARLTRQKDAIIKEHLELDNEIREFNGTINEKYAPKNEKYAPKQEPVLSVEE